MPYYVGDTVSSYVEHVTTIAPDGTDFRNLTALEQMNPSFSLGWRDYLQAPERSGDVSISKTLRPLQRMLTTPRRSLPDNVTPNGGSPILTVSDKVRAVIEEFEPNTHYFFRVNFSHHDGTPWPEQYWEFRPGPSAVAQALIVEQSPNLDWRPITTAGYRYTRRIREIDRYGTARPLGTSGTVRSAGGFTLDSAALIERDILHDRAFRERAVFFFSDRLVAALKKSKVTGFIFQKVRVEARQVPPYGETDGKGGFL